MMNRALIFVLLTAVLLSACVFKKSTEQASTTRSAGQDQPTTDGSGTGPSLAAAAAKLTDACSLMPAAYVQKLVPGASAPEKERYPLRCTVRNDKSALEITFDTGPDEPVKGAEFIAGLAKGGYLERLDPHSRGDIYLTVILGGDETGTNRNIHVEVAGHDGQDHKADAIDVARAVLSKLAG
jgi:hypothetical protein